jgi:Zn-dependent metalloprotease
MAGKVNRQPASLQTETLHATPVNGSRTATASDKAGRRAASVFSASMPSASLRLNSDLPGFEVKRSAQTDLPIFIRGTVPGASTMSANGRLDLQKAVTNYLNGVKDLLRVGNPEAEFGITETQLDNLNQAHIRMKQTYRGVEVYGSQLILHSRNNLVESLNGRYFPTPTLADVKPAITAEGAINAAATDLRGKTAAGQLTAFQKQLLDYEKPETQLVIYHLNDDARAPRLTWHVTLRPNFVELWEYFVDAKTGKVLHQYNHTCSVDGARTATAKDLNNANSTIHTYQAGSNYYFMDASRPMFNAAKSKFPEEPAGIVWTMDAKNTSSKNFEAYHIGSTSNSWNNPTAVSAHSNSGKAFEYFKNVHNRNAIDGKGGNVIAFINVADDDGKGLDNAYWNGKAMFYGNGRVGFKPLAGSLDVAGHEMSHGVIGNSAKLEYQGQSGAMNESFADIFGAMMDPDDWKIGEDVVKTAYFPSGALRDLSNPHNGGNSLSDNSYQPRVMAEYYAGTEDNGGVHVNSGICNWAYYKFATATGKAKAEKVYYRALTTYLTPKSQFLDLRLAVVQAATDLHGATSAEVNAAKAAFDAVGIFEVGGGNNNPPSDLPSNPGQDFIICYDASKNDSDPNTWYVSGTDGHNLTARSRTKSLNRPSVTDKGDFAYFVAGDHRIKAVRLTGTAQESVVQEDPFWDNVAISKDGKRLAAVSIDIDTSIYVYDFEKSKWAKFRLYNPTYTEGISSGDVQFADAIEWDYTGEYLLYDAYNKIKKGNGSISYWDVGLIKVWDNKTNKWGDGTVEKIFSGLPDGVSIGNPSFSKNSPHIVAFDYFDENANSYSIIGANLQKGEVAVITSNNKTLGYPSYSKADDKIAYTSVSAAGDTVINVLGLKADKINANGTPTGILTEAKWAVWYVQGERKILSSARDITSFKFAGVTPAATGIISGSAITVTVPPTADLKTLVATFAHSTYSSVKVGSVTQVSGATRNDFSSPVTYTVTAQDGATKTYTVTVTKAVNTAVEGVNNISGKLEVFPNPSNGKFRLMLTDPAHKPASLELISSTGAVMHQRTVQPEAFEGGLDLQFDNLQAGMYYLRLVIGEKIAYKKVVIH